MKKAPEIRLADVQAVYSGAEGRLWELLMGEQIHLGGMQSSVDLAQRAGIGGGGCGVDLCCATGAGMRFLLRFCQVHHMTGVDATESMLDLARQRSAAEGMTDRTTFIVADACETGLPDESQDFIWGEDAWCYVEDKSRLVAEAVRLVKPGGVLAFTDWVEGTEPMTDTEAHRYLAFMKFPSVLSLADYRALLEQVGCTLLEARDTGRFALAVSLYINMMEQQLTYDALKRIGFDQALAAMLLGEMRFLQSLAEARKISQGLLVARKPA